VPYEAKAKPGASWLAGQRAAKHDGEFRTQIARLLRGNATFSGNGYEREPKRAGNLGRAWGAWCRARFRPVPLPTRACKPGDASSRHFSGSSRPSQSAVHRLDSGRRLHSRRRRSRALRREAHLRSAPLPRPCRAPVATRERRDRDEQGSDRVRLGYRDRPDVGLIARIDDHARHASRDPVADEFDAIDAGQQIVEHEASVARAHRDLRDQRGPPHPVRDATLRGDPPVPGRSARQLRARAGSLDRGSGTLSQLPSMPLPLSDRLPRPP